MKKMVICPRCHAQFNFEAQCTCQRVEVVPEKIPKARVEILARPVLAAVRAAFEDPAVIAEYEIWLAARRSREAR